MIYRYVGLKPREGHDYMEQLSDFRILDFCEWIKNSVLDKAQYSDIAAYSNNILYLILSEEVL